MEDPLGSAWRGRWTHHSGQDGVRSLADPLALVDALEDPLGVDDERLPPFALVEERVVLGPGEGGGSEDVGDRRSRVVSVSREERFRSD